MSQSEMMRKAVIDVIDIMKPCHGHDLDLINYLTNDNELSAERDGSEIDDCLEGVETISAEVPSTTASVCMTSSDSPVETLRQTRSKAKSKTTTVSKESDKLSSNTKKNQMSVSDKTREVNSAATTSAVLFARCSGNLAKKTSDHSVVTSDEESDSSGSEYSPSKSSARSVPQKRARRQSKNRVTLSRKNTETERTTTAKKKSKSGASSVQIFRVVRPGKNKLASDEDVADSLKAYNRRHAEWARANRLRKKEYLENLEQEAESSREKIGELKSVVQSLEGEREALKKEVQYLRSVLANQSLLSKLLHNIPDVAGVALSSSMLRKRGSEADAGDGPSQAKKRKSPGGVCLHVDDGRVSLEACQSCAEMAWESLCD